MLPNQEKIIFNSYTDGVLQFGRYIEGYDDQGNASKKEFVSKGRLFFALSSIREQDQLKYADTGIKVTLKLKTPFIRNFNPSSVIKLNDSLFSIGYLDSSVDKRNLFLYLTELRDELNEKVEILKLTKISSLKSPELRHVKTVWADIKSYGYKTSSETIAAQVTLPVRKKVIIRYLSWLNPSEAEDLTLYRIRYKGKVYQLLAVDNVEEESKLLELTVEAI
ncbi:phage head closure protein [Turicibacter sanguinis]|uniref:phage head closure protein n=1 Tax=Turicibacter sanguinis TaxID=154288 RepID=UPI0012BBDBBA|nr:phage head closure protein [Turicibacter sanguinis]MDB8437721.1 phage head closure protein [Turicibacter sanguinis]MTP73633.1 phage head closure protein [Turicibacter sanguinis]